MAPAAHRTLRAGLLLPDPRSAVRGPKGTGQGLSRSAARQRWIVHCSLPREDICGTLRTGSALSEPTAGTSRSKTRSRWRKPGTTDPGSLRARQPVPMRSQCMTMQRQSISAESGMWGWSTIPCAANRLSSAPVTIVQRLLVQADQGSRCPPWCTISAHSEPEQLVKCQLLGRCAETSNDRKEGAKQTSAGQLDENSPMIRVPNIVTPSAPVFPSLPLSLCLPSRARAVRGGGSCLRGCAAGRR